MPFFGMKSIRISKRALPDVLGQRKNVTVFMQREFLSVVLKMNISKNEASCSLPELSDKLNHCYLFINFNLNSSVATGPSVTAFDFSNWEHLVGDHPSL